MTSRISGWERIVDGLLPVRDVHRGVGVLPLRLRVQKRQYEEQ